MKSSLCCFLIKNENRQGRSLAERARGVFRLKQIYSLPCLKGAVCAGGTRLPPTPQGVGGGLFAPTRKKTFPKGKASHRCIMAVKCRRATLRTQFIELQRKLRFFSRCCVFVENTLCNGLVNFLECCFASRNSVLGISFCYALVKFLYASFQVSLDNLISQSLCTNNFNSLFCGFNIRHNFTSRA